MGLLIDSTVLIHAERQRRTVERLIHDIMERFGDVDLAMSVMSAGAPRVPSAVRKEKSLWSRCSQ